MRLKLDYPPEIPLAGDEFFMRLTLELGEEDNLSNTVDLKIKVNANHEETVELNSNRDYLASAHITLSRSSQSTLEFFLQDKLYSYSGSEIISHSEPVQGTNNIILRGGNHPPSIVNRAIRSGNAIVDGVNTIDNDGFPDFEPEQNQFKTVFVDLHRAEREDLIIPPVYVELDLSYEERLLPIQAFKSFATIGRGSVLKDDDADIRLFQKVSHRFTDILNHSDIDDAIIKGFSRQHCFFQFNDENNLLFSFCGRNQYPELLQIDGKQVTPDSADDYYSINFDEQKQPGKSVIEFALTIAYKDFHINFSGVYYAGEAVIFSSPTMPTLGDIIIINESIKDRARIPLLSAQELKLELKNNKWLLYSSRCTDLTFARTGERISV